MDSDSFDPPALLVISQAHFEQIIRHLQRVYPEEGCGIAAGLGHAVTRVYPVRNRLQSSTAFEMDPEQQLRAMLDLESQGWQMLAIYHSHPHGPQTPSPTDVSMAYYPESAHLIVSLAEPSKPAIRAFTIVAGQINEIPLSVE